MAFKFLILTALLAVACARIISTPSAAVAVAHPPTTLVRTESYDPHPQYSYGYSVADGLTGDNKAQHETRNGDVVQGSYSLVEPDGTRRTVSYAADSINGFNAVVRKNPNINVHAHASTTEPGQIYAQQPYLTSGSVIATANANIYHQPALAVTSPYVTSALAEAGSLYDTHPVYDTLDYGSSRLVRVH
ncbi:larval cuticle protein A1A-like isoform X2 [Chelonus insularis]|uniref:larval cuticle protein A1A-like isoform X2 n=1 Tax=Chelonus insularis TaxID=460826 RepID=UPI00158D51A9|nr:larval cuticle protein A1A-like isoform X2 [Chelonus insularis]